jgi:two-component system, cell cycle response regulator
VKILVVDDNAELRLIIEALLTQHGWEVVTATNGDEAYAFLQKDDAPPLAIVDWMMPGMSGPELCRKLRESDETGRTYILMLTGRRETDDMVTALDSGADDFIAKPFNVDELQARLRAAQRLIIQREQLRTQANIDELTGILNRAAIRETLSRALEQASRENTAVSVVVCDADRFKQVNDAYGHPVGDAVLRGLAKRLRAVLRPNDAVGRYGGEEFLIVLPGSWLENAMAVAKRLRENVCGEPLQTSAGLLPMTVSLGVASGNGDNLTLDNLISEADQALYLAKQRGRNRVEGPVNLCTLSAVRR